LLIVALFIDHADQIFAVQFFIFDFWVFKGKSYCIGAIYVNNSFRLPTRLGWECCVVVFQLWFLFDGWIKVKDGDCNVLSVYQEMI